MIFIARLCNQILRIVMF